MISILKHQKKKGGRRSHLLFPGLQFFDQEVVAFGDLGQFRVHASLEVDEVLPGLHSIPRVLVALSDDLVEMSHRDLGHERLLHGATEDGLHAGVATLDPVSGFSLFQGGCWGLPVSRTRGP
jgi:hypothetical protein